MKIYIIEDDEAVMGMLEDIIEGEALGTLCSAPECRIDLTDVLAKAPDLILTDLLMPKTDGIQIIRALKAAGCQAKFIVISQVSSKEMIARAYCAGASFYVQKPINRIEVCQVVRNAAAQIENEKALAAIRSVFAPQSAPPAQTGQDDALRRRLRYILSQLGMSGERGMQDIMDACCFLRTQGGCLPGGGIQALCAALRPEAPRSMEQRMRRAMERSLRHLASLGIEDYTNEVFVRYGAHLFPFEELRQEMAAIRGRGEGGHVRVKTFLDGLLVLLEE